MSLYFKLSKLHIVGDADRGTRHGTSRDGAMEGQEMEGGRNRSGFRLKIGLTPTPHHGRGRRDKLEKPKITRRKFHLSTTPQAKRPCITYTRKQ